jgi:uncharacterized damage-inducible protein DinB
MRVEVIRQLFDYNYGSHRHLWESIGCITDAQYVEAVPYSIGSIRNHMVHLMSVDVRWLARLQNAPLPERLNYADFSTNVETRRKWDEIETRMLAYIAALRDDQLNEIVVYDLPHRGGVKRDPRWLILVHLVNHGTEHRSQVLPILHRLGAPTFEQDLMNYVWGKVG